MMRALIPMPVPRIERILLGQFLAHVGQFDVAVFALYFWFYR